MLVAEHEVDEQALPGEIGPVARHDVEEVVVPAAALDDVAHVVADLERVEEAVRIDERREEVARNTVGVLYPGREGPPHAPRLHGPHRRRVRQRSPDVGLVLQDPPAGRVDPHELDLAEQLGPSCKQLHARHLLRTVGRDRVPEPASARQKRARDVSPLQRVFGHDAIVPAPRTDAPTDVAASVTWRLAATS